MFCQTKMEQSWDLTHLAKLNPHPRDQRITFKEEGHQYIVDGKECDYTSTTTVVHSMFKEFDADKIIAGMMKSRNWPNSKYFGMTADEIKAQWDNTRDTASLAGTKMHNMIEAHYNLNDVSQYGRDMPEYHYFRQFDEMREKEGLVPFRTEWTVFHEESHISGSIDMVYRKPNGNLAIYDWKRCREFKKTAPYNDCAIFEEIAHLPNTNFWHYALQLNIYRHIVQTKYGHVVDELYLVGIHPDNETFQRVKMPILDDEVEFIFRHMANQKLQPSQN